MAIWQNYVQPESVNSALDSLNKAGGNTAIIAGGTDLLLDLQQGRHSPVDTLVDVSGIAEMRAVRQEDNHILLGAAVTHNEIIQHPLLLQHAQCLVEGCGLVGGPQVRNVATIGGNVAHALPAGDGTMALLALNAKAQLASQQGRRWLPLEDLFAGPGQTTFDRSKEILTALKFPLRKPGEGSAARRIMRPQGVAIAILNMSAWMRLSSQGMIEDIRISTGPAGPRPLRARKTEDFLRGKKLDEAILFEASQNLLSEAKLRTSPHRATAEYRQQLIPILLKRVLDAAQSCCKETVISAA